MSLTSPKIAALALAFTILSSGCIAPTTPEEPVGSSPEALTASTVEAVAVVGAVAAALQPVAEEEPAAPAGDEMPPPTPVEGTMGCTALEWNILVPLRVVIHFDQCIAETGDIIDGSVTAWLEYDGVPGAIGVALDNLALGDLTIDGFVVLRNAGPNTTEIDADMSFIDPAQSTRIVLAGTVSTAGDILELDGLASLTVDGETWAADASALRWEDPANCYPTAGSLGIDATGQPPITVTFEGTDVTVQVGALMIPWTLPACPGR